MPDLSDLLSEACDRVAVGAPPGADAAVATARSRKRRRTAAVALSLVTLLGVAAVVVPQLHTDRDRDVVLPTTGPIAGFPSLGAEEQVALLRDIRVTSDDRGIAAFYRGGDGACAGTGRWDLEQTPTQVRARFVLTEDCAGGSGTRTATTSFAAPLGQRRLVVQSGASEVVVRGDGALVFAPLAAGEEVAKLGFPAVLAGGASLTARYSSVTCTKEQRWEVLESPTEVRARLVITDAPRPDLPGCLGQAPGVRDPVVTFGAPIAGRRLVVMSGVYELIVRDTVPARTAPLPPAALPAAPPAFAPLAADERLARSFRGGVRSEADGRGLVLANSGCGDAVRLEVVESISEVRLRLVATTPPRRLQPAVAYCFSGTVRAPLVAPLGDREVVLVTMDAERVITPFDGTTLLEPALPNGFLEEGSSQAHISAQGTTWSQGWRDPRLCAPGPSSITLTQGPGADIALRVTNWTKVGTRDVNGVPAELRRGNTGEYVLLWDTAQGRVGLTEGRVTTKGCSHFQTAESLLALARTLHPKD